MEQRNGTITNSYGLYIPNRNNNLTNLTIPSTFIHDEFSDIGDTIITIYRKNAFLYNLYRNNRRPPYLSIICSCDKKYEYKTIESIPLNNIKCSCGVWIIKFNENSTNIYLYGGQTVLFGDVNAYNIKKIRKIQKWWRKIILRK